MPEEYVLADASVNVERVRARVLDTSREMVRRTARLRAANRWQRTLLLVALPLLVAAGSAGFVLQPERAAGHNEPSRAPRIVVAGLERHERADATLPPGTDPVVATPSASDATDDSETVGPRRFHDASDLLRYYTVVAGDSLWTIATHFHLTVSTLVWANDMTDPTYIQLGQVLVIPPCNGLIYSVQPTDTLESIATKYGITTYSILEASHLDSPVLIAGEVLMLPGASGPPISVAKSTPAPAPKKPSSGGGTVPRTTGTARWGLSRTYNGFTYGYCTWGAAELFHNATGVFPGWVGDAWLWARNAKAAGWTVTATARTRAVVVFPPWVDGAYGVGHVAWVMGLSWSSRTITIREMNGPAGWGHWGTRTVPMDSRLRYILAP